MKTIKELLPGLNQGLDLCMPVNSLCGHLDAGMHRLFPEPLLDSLLLGTARGTGDFSAGVVDQPHCQSQGIQVDPHHVILKSQ